jgi:hypothetical protein
MERSFESVIDDKMNTLTQAVNELRVQGVAQQKAIVAAE